MRSYQLSHSIRRMTPERKRQILEGLSSGMTEEPKETPTALKNVDLEEVGQLFRTYSSQTSREASTDRAARRRADLTREVSCRQSITQFNRQHPFAPSPRSTRDPLLFNRLAKPKTEVFIKREMQKRRNDESLSFQSHRSGNSSIAERLIEQGEIDRLNREMRIQAKADSEAADLTFSPQVDSASHLLKERRLARLPVHLRVRLI